MQSRKTRFLTAFGLTVGMLSGAIAAYFLAPKKGKDTQKILMKQANQVTQKSIKTVQKGLLQFEGALKNVK